LNIFLPGADCAYQAASRAARRIDSLLMSWKFYGMSVCL